MVAKDRTPLAVIVVIANEEPKQCENWEAALRHVGDFAAGDDPVLVSMFQIYWGDGD